VRWLEGRLEGGLAGRLGTRMNSVRIERVGF
jgi:hypothetical protein